MDERRIEQTREAAEAEAACDIDLITAREEATWYSLVNVMAMGLGSGMGVPFDEDESRELMSWTGVKWDDLRFRNPLPLKAVFRGGDPHLVRGFDDRDLETWRWSPESFDRVLVPQAQGWSIIAEIECAKWFANPLRVEAIPLDLRIWSRALGAVLWSMARGQLDFSFNHLRDENGLFVAATEPGSLKHADTANDLADQACMLWACSDAASLAALDDSPYANDNSHLCSSDSADALFQAIVDCKKPLLKTSTNRVRAESLAILALVWYSAATGAQDLKARCFWLLREFADDLVKAEDASETVGHTLVDAAAALRALTEAFRVTRLRTYAECATRIFAFMESQWWARDGVYAQTPVARDITYNADDIGVILGALNAARLFLGERVDREIADRRMRVFFCKAANFAGMQMSMPSTNLMPEWFRECEPECHFRYSSMPLPQQAGGEFGIAPVFAEEMGFEPQTEVWSRRTAFDAPAAMRACCEMLWMNSEAIRGYPDVKLEHLPTEIERAAPPPDSP